MVAEINKLWRFSHWFRSQWFFSYGFFPPSALMFCTLAEPPNCLQQCLQKLCHLRVDCPEKLQSYLLNCGREEWRLQNENFGFISFRWEKRKSLWNVCISHHSVYSRMHISPEWSTIVFYCSNTHWYSELQRRNFSTYNLRLGKSVVRLIFQFSCGSNSRSANRLWYLYGIMQEHRKQEGIAAWKEESTTSIKMLKCL